MSKVYGSAGVEVNDKPVSKWIEVGTAPIVKFTDFEYVESAQKKTPGIKFKLVTGPQDNLPDGQKVEETWWLSEKAFSITSEKFILAADKMGLREKLDARLQSVNDDRGYVDAIADVFSGQKAAVAIGGVQTWIPDEKTGKQGLWIKPKLIPYGWVAEATAEGVAHLEARIEDLKMKEKLIEVTEKPADITPQEQGDNGSDGGVDW